MNFNATELELGAAKRRIAELEARVKELEAERDRLAAENAGLREALATFTRPEAYSVSNTAMIEYAHQALAGDGSAVLAVIELLRFWFSPWGAAKGEMWENMSGDRAFTADNMLELMRAKLDSEDVKEALDDG